MGDMNIKSALEAILFAAGEPVPAARISLILEQDEETVWDAARELSEQYEKEGRGIRILKLDNTLPLSAKRLSSASRPCCPSRHSKRLRSLRIFSPSRERTLIRCEALTARTRSAF